MPWVRFVEPFAFVPLAKPQISIAYKRGMVLLVTTECAEAAILRGRAVRAEKPRNEANGAARTR